MSRDDALDRMHKIMAKYLDAMLEDQESVPTELWNSVEKLLRLDAAEGTVVPCFSFADGKLKVKVLHTEFLVDLWEDDLVDMADDCLDEEDAKALLTMLETTIIKLRERLGEEYPSVRTPS